MISAVRPLADALFPPSLARTAGRVGTICFVFAFCVAVLFPVSAAAGTEVPAARIVTASALGLAGVAFSFGRNHVAAVAAGVLLLVAGAVFAPAGWLYLLAGLACVYCASSLIPRAPFTPGPDDLDVRPEPTQELVEALATALVLALVVREFGFEAFKIPTGSMEPTILGDSGSRKGDRLLAFKQAVYRRWDIVVFKFPLFRNTNYIKRLIGLPGETLEIVEGDIYVNGVIAPKPDDVQQIMWRPNFEPPAGAEWIAHFDPDDAGVWRTRTGFAEASAQPGSVAWLQAKAGFEDDLRISFDVEVPAGVTGRLLVSVEGAKRRCELALDAASARVTGPGLDATIDGVSLASLGPKFRLGFSMADRIVRVQVDGRQVARFQHPDRENGGLEQGRARIGVEGQAVVVRAVVGENDLRYGNSGMTKFDIPDDGYVMLGDNTLHSRDSRAWTANVVRLKDGTEYVAPDVARVTEDREESVFRSLPDGGVELTDSYGVPHKFTKDEIDSVRRNVPQPFVRERDLVGRAFLTFFPVPLSRDFLKNPSRDFRPRLLR